MKTIHLYSLVSICVFSAIYVVIWTESKTSTRFICTKQGADGQCLDDLADIIYMKADDENCLNRSKMFENALLQGTSRSSKAFLTIGIPSIKRPGNASYLLYTLEDLIRKTNPVELKQLILLVFLADIDAGARAEINESVSRKFSDHIKSGVIQIIQAPKEFYPSFDNLERTYRHTVTKVKWRSKQNYDYAFMMLYSRSLSTYYMQLEDDVSTVPGYIGIIKTFIGQQRNKHWTCLEFSALGFIAKLYHSYDLEKLAKLLMLFFYEQPNDVTYLSFNHLKLQEHRIVRKPTIFKHHGLYSTLGEKRETRVDPLFEESQNINSTKNASRLPEEVTILNPPAKIISTLKIYNHNTPDKCYFNKELLWSYGPKKGENVMIVFNDPQKLSSVSVVSGPDDHPDDFLQNGILNIGQTTAKLSDGKPVCSGILASKKFKFGRAQIEFDSTLKQLDVACVQILVIGTQINWLQVSEISIKAKKKKVPTATLR